MAKVVVFDGGHGGKDQGASGHGIIEKEYVLDLAKRAKAIMETEYKNVEVKLTRDDDTYLTLGERARIARNAGADAFVSIHNNAFNAQSSGVETFVHSHSSASRPLAKKLKDEILAAAETEGHTPDRGVKSANFGVLRGTYKSMLAVLTEVLFLSHKGDTNILKSSGMKDKLARAHVEAVADELNLKSSGKRASGSAKASFADRFPDVWDTKKDEWKDLQALLHEAGIDAGPVDGHFGQKTLDAIRTFQKKHELSSPQGDYYGVPGPATLSKLLDMTGSTTGEPPKEQQESAPEPEGSKKWRLVTGTFPDADALANGIKRLEDEYGWLLYEKAESTKFNPTYRIYTGHWVGKNVAEYHADQLREETNWTVYVIEA